MKDTGFDLRLLSLKWLKGVDNPYDLCAHGAVFLKIGPEVLVDVGDGDEWTVSAAGLHLMRTVFQDHSIDDFPAQLIPCCGFALIASGAGEVEIIGCDSGFDWNVAHEGAMVHHRSAGGSRATIALEDYKELIRRFVDPIEAFYRNSKPKEIPKDRQDKEGYAAFWSEWQQLRQRLGGPRITWALR